MITVLQSIPYTENALAYCEKGGELLSTNDCLGNAAEIYCQMKERESRNNRCVKKSFHIKIRAAPEDKGRLSNQDWIDIADQYACKIGFQDNLYAVYIHEEDTESEHIHIVASRIGDNNLAVPDGYTNYKSLDFSREIEKKYNLRRVKRKLESIKQETEFIADNGHSKEFRSKIAAAIEISDSLEDLVFHLENQKVRTKIGKGISFINSRGVKKKGSEIDRNFSLAGIKSQLNIKTERQTPVNQTKIINSKRISPGISK
jgi:hypothetical protein